MKQIFNYFILNRHFNEAVDFYKYLIRIIKNNEASPMNYQETIYEGELQFFMSAGGKSRKDCAIKMIKHFAPKLPPFSINIREYKSIIKKHRFEKIKNK